MVIFFNVDENGHLNGWSSTQSSEDDISLYVQGNHEVLNNPFIFKYIDGELIKDEDKQQDMIDEQEAEENKLPVSDENSLAIMEMANMLAMIMMPQVRTMSTQSIESGGETMIAILFASNIVRGLWTYDNVAEYWKPDVKAILIAEGREDLIK